MPGDGALSSHDRGVLGAEEISVRGSWGKSWINRSRPQVPARGTPTEERTWLLWEDGVQETYRNALSLETSLAEAQSSRWRVEAVAETAETGRPLVCLILSVNT